MKDIDKLEMVINGLVHELDGCMFQSPSGKMCWDCKYKEVNGCLDLVLSDAIKLIKEQQKEIEERTKEASAYAELLIKYGYEFK